MYRDEKKKKKKKKNRPQGVAARARSPGDPLVLKRPPPGGSPRFCSPLGGVFARSGENPGPKWFPWGKFGYPPPNFPPPLTEPGNPKGGKARGGALRGGNLHPH
eukprot:FR744075.1.p5 GENE.FR744075.1~~FR744075.1.p5  ORF type:complete len:104 (+),score=53.50 FR744075.1:782-1093(+)